MFLPYLFNKRFRKSIVPNQDKPLVLRKANGCRSLLHLLIFGGTLASLLAFCGCQPHEGSERQLKEDVDSFAIYYYNWHFEKAAKYCTSSSQIWMRYAASNVHPADIELLKIKQEDATTEIKDIDFGDDEISANVEVEVTNFLQMDTIGREAHTIPKGTYKIPMVMEEGKWKVRLESLPVRLD